jgi:cholesterol transport system auxiliary component
MSPMRLAPWVMALALAGCGGVFDSTLPSPQAYVLRLPTNGATTPPAASERIAPLLVQRPEAGPGLDSNGIVLLRGDRRFDFYAASRWAAPAPDLIESVVVEGLRRTGAFQAVFDDGAPFAPTYNLRLTLRRFEADYTTSSGAPTVFVVIDCTVGRHRDRELLASFTATGSAAASEDRLGAVVAAFEAATATAVAEIQRVTTTTLAASPK